MIIVDVCDQAMLSIHSSCSNNYADEASSSVLRPYKISEHIRPAGLVRLLATHRKSHCSDERIGPAWANNHAEVVMSSHSLIHYFALKCSQTNVPSQITLCEK